MRYTIALTSLLFLTGFGPIKASNLLKPKIFSQVEKGKIFTKSQVNDAGPGRQKLFFKIAGIHEKTCKKAFRKLSRYENYENYLDVVKKSKYSDQTNRVYFRLESPLLPFVMGLDFIIPRITKAGDYKFRFDKGFLKGLTGNIHVIDHKKRCLIISDAKWEGPHSKIPNVVFEFFMSALGKLTMDNLFRISKN